MSEALHSPIGASTCERWWNCPGSFHLAAQKGEGPSSYYAAEGTAAHELGEFYLKARSPVDDHWLGRTIEVKEHDATYQIPVDEGMLQAVSVYVDFVLGLVDRYHMDDSQFWVERSFNLAHIDPDAFGTCDASLFIPMDRLIIIDYKHGAGVAVNAQDNKQTLYYGLGAYWELTPEERAEINRVETIIVQPRASHPDGPIRRSTYRIDRLLQWQSELHGAVRRIRSGVTTLEAGPHCKFCPAKAECPELEAQARRQCLLDFGSDEVKKPELRLRTPEELAKLLDDTALIKDWCSEIRTHVQARAEAGEVIPGYELVERQGDRQWKDEKVVAEDLETLVGPSIYSAPKLKSPAQLEKLFKPKQRTFLNDYMFRPAGGKTLVKIENAGTRPKRQANAVEDFANVNTDRLSALSDI